MANRYGCVAKQVLFEKDQCVLVTKQGLFAPEQSRPHFHAYYQDDVGIFSINPVELVAGSLPKRQRRLVEAWAELHQAELAADWEQLQQGRAPKPIEPLK